MKSIKNPNVLLSLIFSLVSVISGFLGLTDVIMKYPVSFSGTFLFSLNFLIFASALFIFTGILFEKRTLMITGIGILIPESLLYAFFYLHKTVRFLPSAIEAFNFLILLIPVITYLFLLLYITDIFKVKKLVAFMLIITFIISVFSAYFFGGFSVVLLISTFGLLLYYVNLKDADVKVNTGEVFFLSFLTFGLFYILWSFYTLRKVKMITEDTTPSFPECLFFIFLPCYASYWFYTRYENLNEKLSEIKDRGVLSMILSLIFLSPLSLSILQRDLNKVSEKFVIQTNASVDEVTKTEDTDI